MNSANNNNFNWTNIGFNKNVCSFYNTIFFFIKLRNYFFFMFFKIFVQGFIFFKNTNFSICKIGNNCNIKSNSVIGGKGFGFEEKNKVPIEHFGDVLIGDNSYIGSNTTIDRAVFDSTKIGSFSHIDNLVQIAHNVELGKHSIIAAQVGIAGSTVIGDNVKIGGQAGISGHLNIGNNVTIAGKSGVTKNLKDNAIVAGFPAIDIKKWKLNIIKFNRKQ